MKYLLLALALFAAPAVADDCSLKKLDACKTSNQFFWRATSGRDQPRTEFTKAFSVFLQRTPKLYEGTQGFTPAQIAKDSLTGPGDHHDHLPGGGWFFDGFLPHYAAYRGAILFDEDGSILAIALRTEDTDKPDKDLTGKLSLRIYAHGELEPAQLKIIREWADKDIETRLIRRDGKKWTSTTLP